MNVESKIKTVKVHAENTLSTLELCRGFSDVVSHVDGINVFCYTVNTFDKLISTLRMFANNFGSYSINHYNMLDDATFYVNYCFDYGFSLCLYTFDIDTALSSIGNGKCRIVESTETTKSIVCNEGKCIIQ